MPYQRKQTSSNFFNELFLNQDCLLTSAFGTIQGRWTMQVLVCVYTGYNRFGLIKEKLPGITDHVLALRLNQLVSNDLVAKETVGPDRVYRVRPSGDDLIEILQGLVKWEQKRLGTPVRASRCVIKKSDY